MVAFAVTTRAVVWIEIVEDDVATDTDVVTTRAVVWIEISTNATLRTIKSVTTRAVVWIEIPDKDYLLPNAAQSPPVRWCGLKWIRILCLMNLWEVTTRAVVWIEICISPT